MRLICDGSAQTFMLTSWVRDIARGDRYHLPLEFVVKKQSRDTARLFGMYDRGTLEPGMRADINLIDFNNLQIDTPRVIKRLAGRNAPVDADRSRLRRDARRRRSYTSEWSSHGCTTAKVGSKRRKIVQLVEMAPPHHLQEEEVRTSPASSPVQR
jgi:N-acyl-D-aspartate/D-glutamate deacylase